MKCITLVKHSNCISCGAKLKGRQRSYCSRQCKSKFLNSEGRGYDRQSKRGLKRKLDLVKKKGGSCEICGYRKNLTALTFHHLNDKKFNLDSKNIANHKWEDVLLESGKCQLLCHNCHMETHHPEFDIKSLDKLKTLL